MNLDAALTCHVSDIISDGAYSGSDAVIGCGGDDSVSGGDCDNDGVSGGGW